MLQPTTWIDQESNKRTNINSSLQDIDKKHLTNFQVDFKNGQLNITAQTLNGRKWGWNGIGFQVNEQLSSAQAYNPEPANTDFHQVWRTNHESLQLEETLVLSIDPDQYAVTVSRFLQPQSRLRIDQLADGMLNDESGLLTWTSNQQLRIAHTNHLRVEHYPRSRADYPLLRLPAYELKKYGLGESNDLPVLYLTDEVCEYGLMEVSLIEHPLRRIWSTELAEHMSEVGFKHWHATMQPIGSDHLDLDPNQRTLVSCTEYRLVHDLSVADAFAAAALQVAQQFPARGKISSMRHGACYCTWNYGPERDIDHNALIKRAQIIRKHFPDVHHFLIDDGYQRGPRTLDPFYPDPEQNIDQDKFPKGIKALAKEIRDLGLEPGIWFSPTLNLNSQLAREHPDWLLLDDQNRPFCLGTDGYLDMSVEPAREWMLKVLDMLYGQDRYIGCKLDFQSQMFESDKVRYRQGNGLIWRDWFYQQIRNRIGKEGFFETCIAMSMGNPHLSQWCDGYRVGADIQEGTWQRHVDSARWTLPVLSIPGNQSLMLNADSFGWNHDESMAVNRHRST